MRKKKWRQVMAVWGIAVLLMSACSGDGTASEHGAGAESRAGSDEGSAGPESESPGSESGGERTSGPTYMIGGGGEDTSYNDLGVIFTGASREHSGISYFFDPESGICVPICTKINCAHEGYDTFTNPTPGCDAFLAGFCDCDAIIGDYLYYVETDADKGGFRYKNFCRADVNGTKRKILHSVEDAGYCNYAAYEDDYLIYVYYDQYDENGKMLDTRDPGIYLLNLATGKLKQIDMPAAYEGYIGTATIDEGALYYTYFYAEEPISRYSYEELQDPEVYKRYYENARLELWKYDIAAGEKICLQSIVAGDIKGSVTLRYGHLLIGDLNGKMHLEELSTGQVWERDADSASVWLFDEGATLYKDGALSVWRYDTGKVELKGRSENEEQIFICGITEHWVYAELFDKNGRHLGKFYMPRERFMKGEWEWKQLPEM